MENLEKFHGVICKCEQSENQNTTKITETYIYYHVAL